MAIGLIPAVVLALVVLVNEPSGGAAAAAVALVGIPALPLWWRWHSNAFRLSAGLIGGAFTIVSLWAALAGGLLVLPTGLLLLSAALVPAAWSLPLGLAAVLGGMAAAIVVPFLLYGAYTCVRPVPTLDVAMRGDDDALPADTDDPGVSGVSRRPGFIRVEFDRGAEDQRDRLARQLRVDPTVGRVRARQDRCG